MTRTLLILTACLFLSGCEKEEIDRGISLLTAPVERESLATVAVVEEAVEPEPEPVCEDYLWRAQWFDCHGNYLRDL